MVSSNVIVYILFDKLHITTFGLFSTSKRNNLPGRHKIIAVFQLPKGIVLIKWAGLLKPYRRTKFKCVLKVTILFLFTSAVLSWAIRFINYNEFTISGFFREEGENCVLVGYCAASGGKFERGHLVVYYQICVLYYVPSIHNIHQDNMQ